MRLRRFHLTRYGHFTDFTLDFGEKQPDVPDFHLIYGPNESGKSTAFSGYLDLLYGVARNSRYDFKHGDGTLQVAADIEFRDGVRHFKRLKKTRDSLLDGLGAPTPEQAILAELGGVSREQYQLMFLLDDESLEKGGDSILRSESDLGRLLFSATSGLADIGQRLAALRADSDKIHRKSASTTAIAEAKKAIVDLDRKIREIDTTGAAHAALVEARDKAQRGHLAALNEQSRSRTDLDLALRQRRALERLVEWQRLKGRIDPQAGVSLVTDTLAKQVSALKDRRVAIETKVEALLAETARLEAERDAIPLDGAALSLAEAHAALHELRSRFAASRVDLPKRRETHDAALLDLGAVTARLELPPGTDPETLPIGTAVTSALRDLISRRGKLETEHELARREANDAEFALEQARGHLAALPGVVLDEAKASALAATLEAVQAGDGAGRLRSMQRDVARVEARLATEMGKLSPWRGDEEVLRALSLPEEETLQRLGRARDEATRACEKAVREVDELTRKRDEAAAQVHALATDTGVLSEAQRAEIRLSRDAAWALHRRMLDAATADAFETAMRQDDSACAAQLADVQSGARLASFRQEVMATEALLVPANDRLAAATAALHLAEAAIAALIGGLFPDFPAGFDLPELTQWLRRCRTARESLDVLEGLRANLSEAACRESDATARLVAALAKAGLEVPVGLPLDDMMQAARAALTASAAARQSQQAFKDRTADIERRRKIIADVDGRLSEWGVSWAENLSKCWLGNRPQPPATHEIEDILKVLEPVSDHLKELLYSRSRIEAMEQDEAEFRVGITAIARKLGVDPDVYDTGRLDQILHDRIAAALSAKVNHSKVVSRLAEAMIRRQEQEQGRSIFEAERDDVLGTLAAPDLAAAGAMVEAYRQQVAQDHHARELESNILDELRLTEMAAALHQLDGLDSAELDARILACEAQLKTCDTAVPTAYAALSEARGRLDAVGGDDAVAKLHALRRTKLLEIEEHACQYLALQAGALAAERAIRQFRDEHRSGMLRSASEAFRTVSRGAYAGLATQPGRDGDVLVALSEAGGSKLAADLSKGTRFQLYLALRIAGYREFARMHPPVPFVADDILETFDNDRTSETLRLLSDMAHVGQVICFTHHLHVCDLVREVAPTTHVHSLARL